MKNNVLNFFILVFSTIALAEIINVSFKMMNQSNTYTFYLGLVILLGSLYLYGYYGHKVVKKFIEILKQESLDENEK
jgi:hypothetical protein